MLLFNEWIRAIRMSLVLWILVAVLYPALMLVLGQLTFPERANGSLLTNAQGQVVGSALIGQPFQGDRYFWSRPSAVNYSTANPQNDADGILQTGISGASNLAPGNPALLDRIRGNTASDPSQSIVGAIPTLEQANIPATADLIYTSGSGLDPHITPAAAGAQIDRIAQVRGLNANRIDSLIQKHTERRFFSIFGEPGVNVLKLNLALDALQSSN